MKTSIDLKKIVAARFVLVLTLFREVSVRTVGNRPATSFRLPSEARISNLG